MVYCLNLLTYLFLFHIFHFHLSKVLRGILFVFIYFIFICSKIHSEILLILSFFFIPHQIVSRKCYLIVKRKCLNKIISQKDIIFLYTNFLCLFFFTSKSKYCDSQFKTKPPGIAMGINLPSMFYVRFKIC